MLFRVPSPVPFPALLAITVLGVLLGGCATSPLDAAIAKGDVPAALLAYKNETYATGPHPRDLARISEVVLVRGVRSGNPILRRAALAELARAGAFGVRTLWRLEDEDLGVHANADVAKALAPPAQSAGPAPHRPSVNELIAWLGSTERDKRLQAAVLLRDTKDSVTLLRPRLALETDDQVLLQVAIGLRADGESKARRREVLTRLMALPNRIGLEASTELAVDKDPAGLARLREFATDPDVALRRSAVWSLARDAGHPEDAKKALVDIDALVRIRAAGGILASLTLVGEG